MGTSDGFPPRMQGPRALDVAAMLVDKDRLMALFGASQELPPLGIDYYSTWLRHCRYLDDHRGRGLDLEREFTIVNADFEAMLRQPTIYVTLHFDAFSDGIGHIARTLRRSGLVAPLTAVVGGETTDAVYGRFNEFDHDPRAAAAHRLESVGIDDTDFTAEIMSTLRNRGSLFAVIDANQGTSDQIDAPFLYHRMSVRSGLFRLARASRAVVQPFVVDSEAGRVFFGPSLEARAAPVRRTVEDSLQFLAHHVLRHPERWLHWKHCIALTTQRYTRRHPEETVDSAVPEWHLAADSSRLAFNTRNHRLFELDEATHSRLVRAS